MKCPNCNSEIAAADEVCKYCGMLQPISPVSITVRRNNSCATFAGENGSLSKRRRISDTNALYNQRFYAYDYATRQSRQRQAELDKKNQIFREVFMVLLTLHIILDSLLIILAILS
ncbi:MAG: hypothetical protein J1E34_03230 [Oscillospiraceae bacterium]|nr:hypothetical protein [Oscillospiraceae bacterium]